MHWIKRIEGAFGVLIYLVAYGGSIVCFVREQRSWKRQRIQDYMNDNTNISDKNKMKKKMVD